MLETYADRPLIKQLTVKRDFVHSEIGASADLRMDKVELRRTEMRKQFLAMIAAVTIPALALAQAPDAKAKAEQILKQARAAVGDEKKLKELQGLSITDRKSTRLNSSHLGISYAVFCLKKKIK